MASNSELEELKKLLEESPDIEEDSDQKRFLRAIGATPDPKGKVGADILYYRYIKWKEAIGETDVVSRGRFFQRQFGFPAWIKRMVDTGQTIYRLDPTPFPVNSDIRLEMRKLWREEKEYHKRKRDETKTR